MKSRTQDAAEHGNDFDEEMELIALEQQKMDELGIKLMPDKIQAIEASQNSNQTNNTINSTGGGNKNLRVVGED